MAKGGAFERLISKELSLWWTEGAREDIFWRTSGSGGRATVRRKQGKETAGQEGDITAIDPAGQPLIDLCSIELKRGHNHWSIGEIVDSNKKSWLKSFFDQCERERSGKGCIGWWLIVKQDRKKTLIFFNSGFRRVLVNGGFEFDTIDHIVVVSSARRITCMAYELFLEKVSPGLLK